MDFHPPSIHPSIHTYTSQKKEINTTQVNPGISGRDGKEGKVGSASVACCRTRFGGKAENLMWELSMTFPVESVPVQTT